jgi:hypothetical protein
MALRGFSVDALLAMERQQLTNIKVAKISIIKRYP